MLAQLILFFITQMGDPTYLRTQEDRDRLNFFEKQYENYTPQGEIPQKLHFIWIGGSALPQDAKKNIAAWAKMHPGWEITIWSERARPSFHPNVQMQILPQLPHLQKQFSQSDNEGERAALAAYEILNELGGVYLDTDTKPKKNLQTFNATHTFYSGLAPLQPTTLSSSVQIAPHIIAATADHPILKKTLIQIQKSWNPVQYEGQSADAIYYRTKNHTLLPLQKAIEKKLTSSDRIYPAATFTSEYLTHEEKKRWLPDEERFAKSVLQKLNNLEKESRYLLYLALLLIAIQLIPYGRKRAR